MIRSHRLLLVVCALASLSLPSTATAASASDAAPTTSPRYRFLLTFDDGPSIRRGFNPTLAVLEQLADNPVQPGIKAVFFVQTRNDNGGGTEAGRAILRRIAAEGHLLGLHSADPRGHVGHLKLDERALAQMLDHGVADLRAITGRAPELVRPPYFAYSARTLDQYAESGLAMLLTDLSARDGVIHVFKMSFRRRSHLRAGLRALHAAAQDDGNATTAVADPQPVIVTFHDVNTFTARHMTEYLQILVEESRAVDLPLADQPFYGATAPLRVAALQRALRPSCPGDAPCQAAVLPDSNDERRPRRAPAAQN